ncbi:hypothetical protein RFI_00588 [Reticulomyxa filosa]|uniref:SCP domain-containing protein n=1 Tax=Reticulomyxa filosa TaxID=46433 RepID=X6PEL2_RETFI|nr:hypothetical protein RFI_00588 [Reticulomyxa filosa]|eukprot:ETO36474.1 hypothetical protein RFI_00588 [Reticulomyxa filosa]
MAIETFSICVYCVAVLLLVTIRINAFELENVNFSPVKQNAIVNTSQLDKRTDVTEPGFNWRYALLSAHNIIRSFVGNGNLLSYGYPRAVDMQELVYSYNMSIITMTHAGKCVYQKNSVRNDLVKFLFDSNLLEFKGEYLDLSFYPTQESIAWFPNAQNLTHELLQELIVSKWLNEYKNYSYSLSRCNGKSDVSSCLELINVLWSKTRYLSCGVNICNQLTFPNENNRVEVQCGICGMRLLAGLFNNSISSLCLIVCLFLCAPRTNEELTCNSLSVMQLCPLKCNICTAKDLSGEANCNYVAVPPVYRLGWYSSLQIINNHVTCPVGYRLPHSFNETINWLYSSDISKIEMVVPKFDHKTYFPYGVALQYPNGSCPCDWCPATQPSCRTCIYPAIVSHNGVKWFVQCLFQLHLRFWRLRATLAMFIRSKKYHINVCIFYSSILSIISIHFCAKWNELVFRLAPSAVPTLRPTTKSPTKSIATTKRPSKNPTKLPTKRPSKQPTSNPVKRSTVNPSNQPSFLPSESPTASPTNYFYQLVCLLPQFEDRYHNGSEQRRRMLSQSITHPTLLTLGEINKEETRQYRQLKTINSQNSRYGIVFTLQNTYPVGYYLQRIETILFFSYANINKSETNDHVASLLNESIHTINVFVNWKKVEGTAIRQYTLTLKPEEDRVFISIEFIPLQLLIASKEKQLIVSDFSNLLFQTKQKGLIFKYKFFMKNHKVNNNYQNEIFIAETNNETIQSPFSIPMRIYLASS